MLDLEDVVDTAAHEARDARHPHADGQGLVGRVDLDDPADPLRVVGRVAKERDHVGRRPLDGGAHGNVERHGHLD